MDSMRSQKPLPHAIGLGLRACHYSYIETHRPNVPWFEVLSDNYLYDDGPSLYHLDAICSSYPVTLHGVGMSLGSTDPLNKRYLKKLKTLIKRTQPHLISDHLSWTSLKGKYFHELLPVPFTDETIQHIANRIQKVQDFLGLQIMIENVSSYLQCAQSTLHEWEFLQAVAEEANCFILLDINNIYVSAYNNGFNPYDYIQGLNTNRIMQFHLGGFSDQGSYLLDTHGSPIHPPIWQLFRDALKKWGSKPSIIEWDNNIPDFNILWQEAQKAQVIMDNYVEFA